MLKDEILSKLWEHQRNAIMLASEYIDGPWTGESHLIKLPTGCGKTGIFATLSRVVYSEKNFLILVPSIALKRQVTDEIKSNFWQKKEIDISSDKLPVKDIRDFVASEFESLESSLNGPFILICVINSLNELRKNYQAAYDSLKIKVDVVIFDEGHREPALSWATAVRGLEKHTILFTATPFRNDLKLFKVNKEKYSYMTHDDAIARNVIRNVSFKEFKTSNLKDKIKNIVSIVKATKANFASTGESLDPKVIIRCENQESVRKVTNVLKGLGKNVLGIHEEFETKGAFSDEVPTKEDLNSIEYVVHQFKLTEGIDYPNFLILVVLDDFNNERSLIQQIGRITRNPSGKRAADAVVICSDRERYQRIWNSFQSFDKNVNDYGSLYDLSDLWIPNKKIDWVYFSGSFKSPILKEKILPEDLQIPSRVNIKINNRGYSFDQVKNFVEEEIGKFDVSVVSPFDLANNGYLLLYEVIKNSPYLVDELYIESKIGFLIFYLRGDRLYFFSTDRIFPESLHELPNLQRENILKVLNTSKRFTRINLINSDIGRTSIRSNNSSAYALENSAIGLMDHSQVTTFTEAVIANSFGDLTRRYVGLANAKVSDYDKDYLNISEFYNWIKDLDSVLNSAVTFQNNYLKRFAQTVGPPINTSASHILIDVEDNTLEDFRITKNSKKHKFRIADSSSQVENDQFKLTLEYNNKKEIFSCNIEFVRKSKRYRISSDQLANRVSSESGTNNLLAYLNRHQPFRIVTKSNERFYAFGSFYNPRLNLLNRKSDLDILDLFITIPDLAAIDSEKGNKNTLRPSSTKWHRDTLFGIVCRLGNGYPIELKKAFNFDTLVCDDLNNEFADFIGLSEISKRISLIHAKADNKQFSASAFQEVCGQAIKNLDILSPFYEQDAERKIKKWDGSWNDGKVGIVKRRILAGKKDGEEILKSYRKLIADPDTKKEVIILTGSLFEKEALRRELAKPDIKDVAPEAIQLVYLIRTTWSAVTSLGATLKIYCH